MARSYYPKGSITYNLYTTGSEWMLQDSTEYVGFYYSTIDGEVRTGAYPSNTSKPLIPYRNPLSADTRYSSITTVDLRPFTAPVAYYPVLVKKDYLKGRFTRYFARRRNLQNPLQDIIEIDKKQFDSILSADTGIDESLYDGIQLEWKLTGKEYDYTDRSGVKIGGVVDTNHRTVLSQDKRYPGLKYKLVDYREYTIYSSLVPPDVLIARNIFDIPEIAPATQAIQTTRSELERR